MRLWHAEGITVDEAVLEFTVGEDPVLDQELLPFDCLASAAHARMLDEIDILEGDELERVLQALREAYELSRSGRLRIRPEQEDAHTALESFLAERAGDAGRKIHTGRSRNDQVIQAIRLLVRERLLGLIDRGEALVEELTEAHHEHHRVLMPGYTHTRQAMPSTVGQLFGAAAEDLLRSLELLDAPLSDANRGALGSASGYGVPLPLVRRRIPELLGLDGFDVNTLFVQNTRGRLESETLFALHQIALGQARLATDFIWLSSEAFGFLRLPEALTTGSSIMPQKRNPDVLELVRAVPSAMLGRYVEVSGLLHGLPSGYHRDLQRTKGPMLAGIAEMERLLVLMATAVRGVEVDPARSEGALDPSIFATDHVYRLVVEGVPFREAYQKVKAWPPVELDKGEVLDARTHVGAPGTDQAGHLRELLEDLGERFTRYRKGVETAELLLA